MQGSESDTDLKFKFRKRWMFDLLKFRAIYEQT